MSARPVKSDVLKFSVVWQKKKDNEGRGASGCLIVDLTQ